MINHENNIIFLNINESILHSKDEIFAYIKNYEINNLLLLLLKEPKIIIFE